MLLTNWPEHREISLDYWLGCVITGHLNKQSFAGWGHRGVRLKDIEKDLKMKGPRVKEAGNCVLPPQRNGFCQEPGWSWTQSLELRAQPHQLSLVSILKLLQIHRTFQRQYGESCAPFSQLPPWWQLRDHSAGVNCFWDEALGSSLCLPDRAAPGWQQFKGSLWVFTFKKQSFTEISLTY